MFALVATALAASLLVNGLRHLGGWSGDAIVHLSLAEHAAQGRWFQFNVGEPVAAETSLAWMALEAAVIRLAGLPALIKGMPLIEAFSMGAAAWLAFLVARDCGARPPCAALAAVGSVALPGVAMNAALGMESLLFAAAVLAFLACGDARGLRGSALVRGPLLGLAILVRPEGVALIPTLLLDFREQRVVRAVGTIAVAAAMVLPFIAFQHALTHAWLPISGISRTMMARRMPTSVPLSRVVWVYGSVPLRVLAFAPLACGSALALTRLSEANGSAKTGRLAVGLTLACGLVGYTVVTGAAHVARQTTWLFSLMSVLAAVGIESWSPSRSTRRTLVTAGLSALFIAAVAAETWHRGDPPFLRGAFLTSALSHRTEATDEVLAAACAGGCCSATAPPRLLATEIERRFYFDDRVVIASADGRSSPTMSYDERGCPDIESVLPDRSIVALVDPPFMGREACRSPGVAAAIDDAWEGARLAPDGWRWNAQEHLMLRVCQPP